MSGPRVFIVDDEAPARERLRALVQDGLGEVVGEARDGAEALERLSGLDVDVVLLDIRMPRMDGLEVARHLLSVRSAPAVVFTTAFDEHALAAFDAGAIDYLLKPVRASRLAAALARARRLAPSDLGPELTDVRTHLSATLNGELRLVPIENVRVLRAEHKYVSVHHTEGVLIIEEALATLEEEFAERFLRVHRNALVATAHVSALKRDDEGALTVSVAGCEVAVEVSRRLAAGVRRVLKGR